MKLIRKIIRLVTIILLVNICLNKPVKATGSLQYNTEFDPKKFNYNSLIIFELGTYKLHSYTVGGTNYIVDIPPYTTIQEFLSNILNSIKYVIGYDENDVTTEYIKTGDKVKIGSNEFVAVVLGDLDGDGKCTYLDILKESSTFSARNVIANLPELELASVDLDHDGKITKYDVDLTAAQRFPERPEDGIENPDENGSYINLGFQISNSSANSYEGILSDGFVQYYQGDYAHVAYGSGTIATCGCGPTAFAMVATNLLKKKITPEDAIKWCGNTYYAWDDAGKGIGTAWTYFAAAAAHFELPCQVIETGSIEEVISALQRGKYVISSQNPGLFTKGGHFIVLSGLDESGNLIVKDPNKVNAVDNGYNNRTFEINEVHSTAAKYWIFE